MTDTPPKRRKGGPQPGSGRKPKAAHDRLEQIALYVDQETAAYLRSLPRSEAIDLKRQAARVLSAAEINRRII